MEKVRKEIVRQKALSKKPFIAFVYEIKEPKWAYGQNYMLFYVEECLDGAFHGCICKDGKMVNVTYMHDHNDKHKKMYWAVETSNK